MRFKFQNKKNTKKKFKLDKTIILDLNLRAEIKKEKNSSILDLNLINLIQIETKKITT